MFCTKVLTNDMSKFIMFLQSSPLARKDVSLRFRSDVLSVFFLSFFFRSFIPSRHSLGEAPAFIERLETLFRCRSLHHRNWSFWSRCFQRPFFHYLHWMGSQWIHMVKLRHKWVIIEFQTWNAWWCTVYYHCIFAEVAVDLWDLGEVYSEVSLEIWSASSGEEDGGVGCQLFSWVGQEELSLLL
jgi:hypothetical protein